jgi:hypothetical protein
VSGTANFDALDRNLSERIERDEWRGTRPAFNRLDANRDGVLTRRELARGDVASAAADRNDYRNAVEHTIAVDSRQQWTNTGIYVNVGDLVTYRATGTIEMGAGGNDRATPNGALSGRKAGNSPRPDQAAGSLLLRIGTGSVAVIGESGSFRAQQSGALTLGVNDDHMGDNRGQYSVWLAVDPR